MPDRSLFVGIDRYGKVVGGQEPRVRRFSLQEVQARRFSLQEVLPAGGSAIRRFSQREVQPVGGTGKEVSMSRACLGVVRAI